jgi:hypothetical protein
MAAVELENRTDRLFGRDADVERLLQRTRRTGLTAIVGAPQIGKSWLLMELARRLDREADARCRVGFTRSPKGANDPLLQVVSDLYQRWLADAGARQQIEAVWEQQKDRLLPAFARFVGKLSEKAGKIFPMVGEFGGAAIKESLEGLVVASEDLRTGRLIVSRLEYTQAQELVSSVHNIADRRIALVMDQWEETRDLDQQRNTFRDFLREPQQWPECHILLGAREGGDAAELLEELQREFPGDAYVYMLGGMDLNIETERRRLVSFLHAHPQLRAIENVADNRVLDLVSGYPRVISRWVADDAREMARTFGGLERLAKEANEFRYSDLEKLLLGLDGDRRKLAVRITLVPLVEDPDLWQELRPIILAGLDPTALDDLKLADILEKDAEAPKFGHPKRRDAARAFLGARRPEAIRAEAEGLIFSLTRSVTVIDTSAIPYSVALVDLRGEARRQKLRPLALALCETAVRFFGERLPSSDSLIEGAREARRLPEPGVGPLLASGLFNALVDASEDGDLALRDTSLDELRGLAHAYADDVPVRQQLAKGLVNTVSDAQAEGDFARRDALLEELRLLARADLDGTPVRGALALGLFNMLDYVRAEGDLARRDALLEELRMLARADPEDGAIRQQLANGLVNTLNHAQAEGEFARRDAFLEELRVLARAYPDDTAMRKLLASGLVNRLNYSQAENDLARRDGLLEELRMLAGAYVEDTAVREVLAAGLYNTLCDAKAEDEPARCGSLGELRALSQAYPNNAVIRERLAGSLFNMSCHAQAEGDVVRRDGLLEELRVLASAYGNEAAVRQLLAQGLVNSLIAASTEGDLARRDAFLEELHVLIRANSDDAALCDSLARGLWETLMDAEAENDLTRRDALLEELRALDQTYPNNAAVRERLARGLFNALVYAEAEGNHARRDWSLNELRALRSGNIDDVAVRESFARGLLNALCYAEEKGDRIGHDALVAELLALAQAFPDDAAVSEVIARLEED